jgi:hypothetical protein
MAFVCQPPLYVALQYSDLFFFWLESWPSSSWLQMMLIQVISR